MAAVQSLLQRGAKSVPTALPDAPAPLVLAIAHGHIAVAELLLKNGVSKTVSEEQRREKSDDASAAGEVGVDEHTLALALVVQLPGGSEHLVQVYRTTSNEYSIRCSVVAQNVILFGTH